MEELRQVFIERNNHYKHRLRYEIDQHLWRYSYIKLQAHELSRLAKMLMGLMGLYMGYCYYFIHGVWYLNLLAMVSSILFGYTVVLFYLEKKKQRFNAAMPQCMKQFRYYLLQTHNVSKAMRRTIEKAPKETKYCLERLQEALEALDLKAGIDKVKQTCPNEWMSLFCTLVYYSKQNGDQDGEVSKNLNRCSHIISFLNLQHEMDDAAVEWAQIAVFLLPILGIPLVQLFNAQLFEALGQTNVYHERVCQMMTAQLLIVSNLSTLFIAWVRRSS